MIIRRNFIRKRIGAACIVMLIGCMFLGCAKPASNTDIVNKVPASNTANLSDQTLQPGSVPAMNTGLSYEDIYRSMKKTWTKYQMYENGLFRDMEGSLDVVEEAVAEEEAPAEDSASMTANGAYGSTNVQTSGVDEGDIVKNDGTYLYQIVTSTGKWPQEQTIQIIDTRDGLKEAGRIEGFAYISEFYVWNDLLLTIENKYLEMEPQEEKLFDSCVDTVYRDNSYHEIKIYDIRDRTNPSQINMFTLRGSSSTSRIADGYFYGFSRYYASEGAGEKDYDAYVPVVDGERIDASQIYLPEDTAGTSYLVMVSIDLQKPDAFVHTAGIVSNSDLYYVSANNIYVADYSYIDDLNTDGWTCDNTKLMRFSYGDGLFSIQAEGDIKGRLNNTFSLDEHADHLRVVTTVDEYLYQRIDDDRTGSYLGYDIMDSKRTNALYVLNKDLQTVGKIEGLAEDERIYSARFMGDVGYFVTFRQTDPLFAVDLSDPTAPKVLSELKVSGFSEYLHAYGEGRLFGLGMEADEDTGVQQGMKLSMFDTSDLMNVSEAARLPLDGYFYSEALYDHHAVMISPDKNLIGFEAEGHGEDGDYIRDYLIYTYQDDAFVEVLKLDTKNENGYYGMSRGTYIGDVFYLLTGDGAVKSYDLNTGDLIDSLIWEEK